MSESSSVLIIEPLRLLEHRIREDNYRGYDPYDALSAPIFKLPLLRSNKFIRLGCQQLLRRSPVNLRPLLGIHPGRNPVTYGLCLQAYSYLVDFLPDRRAELLSESQECLRQLMTLQSKGFDGVCWGYDFDWQARYATIPAFTPNIVATGIIVNALFTYYTLFGDETARDLCRKSANFVLRDLHRSYEGESFCFSYSPFDKQRVINSTMKAARLLVQAYSITGENELLEAAKTTVAFALKHQRADGAWPYAVGDRRTWVDNFHTGYVLDCLSEYKRVSGDRRVDQPISNGLHYYVSNFFGSNMIPRYHDSSTYPVDTTAGAQSILTLARFGHVNDSLEVAKWMISNMFDGSGSFYYQLHKTYTNRISYMRWSNAWMFLALSYLLRKMNDLD